MEDRLDQLPADARPQTVPYTRPDGNADFWRDEHPIGLLGMSHLTTVVNAVVGFTTRQLPNDPPT